MNVVNYIDKLFSEKSALTDLHRTTLYNMIAIISKEDASKLYFDMCYLYMCVTSGDSPNIESMRLMKSIYTKEFVLGIVEVGVLMDRLADSSNIGDLSHRLSKWKAQDDDRIKEHMSHMQNSEINAQWSAFLYYSRFKNKVAFEKINRDIINPVAEWQHVIKMHKQELITKPQTFFASIQQRGLTTEQKRALVYKLSSIYNIIPRSTKLMIEDLLKNIFLCEA